jgi:heme exporter protein A
VSERANQRPGLRAERLTKRFGLRTIFSGVELDLEPGDILAITGSNGSGKSTLMKLLANVALRSDGSVRWSLGGEAIPEQGLHAHIGFVAPYLQLYTEFSAWEHAEMIQGMRGLPFDADAALALFEHFGLAGRRNELLSTYSSGMLQRAKFICALIHSPPFLLLDEPMTNLDQRGIAAMRETVLAGSADRITIIATNEEEDVRLCTKLLSVEGVRG